jgi:hypothetical protein
MGPTPDRSGQRSARGEGLYRPDMTPWFGTFGGVVLCTPHRDETARIERVRYRIKVKPLTITPVLRTVSATAPKGVDPMTRTPVSGLLGRPRNLMDPMRRLDGELAPVTEGTEIRSPCTKGAEGFTELLTVVKFGDNGGWLENVLVDYTVDGDPYTLKVDWEYLGCGKAIEDPDMCPPGYR